MVKILGFILLQIFGRAFWLLFLASFTVVLMLSWRAQLRDEIFKIAAGKVRPRY